MFDPMAMGAEVADTLSACACGCACDGGAGGGGGGGGGSQQPEVVT